MFGPSRHERWLEAQCLVYQQRITALEAQIDDLHRQGLRVATVVEERPPTDELPPLPGPIQAVVDGFEDDEARAEYEAFARSRLAENVPVSEIITAIVAGE
jgi:hypothetical protein